MWRAYNYTNTEACKRVHGAESASHIQYKLATQKTVLAAAEYLCIHEHTWTHTHAHRHTHTHTDIIYEGYTHC